MKRPNLKSGKTSKYDKTNRFWVEEMAGALNSVTTEFASSYIGSGFSACGGHSYFSFTY